MSQKKYINRNPIGSKLLNFCCSKIIANFDKHQENKFDSYGREGAVNLSSMSPDFLADIKKIDHPIYYINNLLG